jgi:hypothetical protein
VPEVARICMQLHATAYKRSQLSKNMCEVSWSAQLSARPEMKRLKRTIAGAGSSFPGFLMKPANRVKTLFCQKIFRRALARICVHRRAPTCSRLLCPKNMCEVLPSAQTSERSETMNSKSRIENPKCLEDGVLRPPIRHVPSLRLRVSALQRSRCTVKTRPKPGHFPATFRTFITPAYAAQPLPHLYRAFTGFRGASPRSSPCFRAMFGPQHRGCRLTCWREGQNQDKTSTLFKDVQCADAPPCRAVVRRRRIDSQPSMHTPENESTTLLPRFSKFHRGA